jgi:hypothetical protein
MSNAEPGPPVAEFLLEARIDLGERLSLGSSPRGDVWMVPFTGGVLEGPQLNGEVLPGTDWQVTRPDGVLEVDARYAIRLSDGALIQVRNRGLVVVPPNLKDVSEVYVRTAPMFQAPSDGPHAWMNKSLFVGTIALAGRKRVVVRMFKI